MRVLGKAGGIAMVIKSKLSTIISPTGYFFFIKLGKVIMKPIIDNIAIPRMNHTASL